MGGHPVPLLPPPSVCLVHQGHQANGGADGAVLSDQEPAGLNHNAGLDASWEM